MAENDENENLLGNSKVKIIKKLNLEGKDIISRRSKSKKRLKKYLKNENKIPNFCFRFEQRNKKTSSHFIGVIYCYQERSLRGPTFTAPGQIYNY